MKLRSLINLLKPNRKKLFRINARFYFNSRISRSDFFINRYISNKIQEYIIKYNIRYAFDEDYYRSQINKEINDCIGHYIDNYKTYDLNPHVLFNTRYYIRNIGGIRQDMSPLVHFYLYGRKVGISPSPYFDYHYYRQHNQDVIISKIDPYEHFLRFGVEENRKSTYSFDINEYIDKHDFLRGDKTRALLHYINNNEAKRNSESLWAKEGDILKDKILRIIDNFINNENYKIDVIIPVYKDYHLTMRCIYSVLTASCKTPFRIIIVDDCSPEEAIREALQQFAKKKLVTLLRHEKNRGFVRSVNEAMSLHSHTDVVLLNSDTEVYGDWLDRLREAACASDDTATVTPLTNSGTICSYPYFCRDNLIVSDCTASELDRMASQRNRGMRIEAPTAVGFCMYIKRVALNDAGLFDEEAFGAGYGEENDFCQRLHALGWKDVIAADVFVRHFGSASFGAQKYKRIARAMEILKNRYPEYHASVEVFCNADPVRPARRNLDIARLENLRKENNILVVTHSRGGGTEQSVQESIRRYENKGYSVYILISEQLHTPQCRLRHVKAGDLPNMNSMNISTLMGRKEMGALLKKLGVRHMEIHHLADFHVTAPLDFLALSKEWGMTYDFILHDYLPICPRINMVDGSGGFCGEAPVGKCQKALKRNPPEYGKLDIVEWRNNYLEFLKGARMVLAPNEDPARRLKRYFPGLNVVVKPHAEVEQSPLRPPKKTGSNIRIGVLGAVSPIKGLDVLRACARHARARKLNMEFVIIGYTSNDRKSRKAGLLITGSYTNAEVMNIIEEQDLDALFFSAVWPETYSYTLDIALRSGLPIMAFDLGAIAARLKGRKNSKLFPLSMMHDVSSLLENMTDFVNSIRTGQRGRSVM